MNDRMRVLFAVGFVVVLFLGVQLGSLALIEPFDESGHQAVEDPENPTNSIVYFGIILVATALMLAAFKYDFERLIQALIIGVSVMISWFVFTEFIPPVVTAAEARDGDDVTDPTRGDHQWGASVALEALATATDELTVDTIDVWAVGETSDREMTATSLIDQYSDADLAAILEERPI